MVSKLEHVPQGNSVQNRQASAPNDTKGSGFGRTFFNISEGAVNRLAMPNRKTEAFDKSLKFTGGVAAAAIVYYENLKIAVPHLKDMCKRFKFINDTLAGFNLIERYNDFTKRNEKKELILFTKGPCKVFNRTFLVGANTCELIIMLQNMGVNFASAAASIGRVPVFKVLANAGVRSVKNVLVISACLMTILDFCIQVLKKIGLVALNKKDKEKGLEWKSMTLSFLNDCGKTALILLASVTMTYGYAAIIMGTNAVALTKIWVDEQKEIKEEQQKAEEKEKKRLAAEAKLAAEKASFSYRAKNVLGYLSSFAG